MFLFVFQEVRLVPDGSLLIHIALILIMIWVLNRTLFRPVNCIIEARERNKGGHSSEAQEILKSVGEKQSRIEAVMLEARSEGYELIERERAQAVAVRQEKIGAVKVEVEQMVARENQQLEEQTRQTRTTLAAEAERMAERISSSILKQA
jgi:F0F1-type ATP synthase membrane subunit b/b'